MLEDMRRSLTHRGPDDHGWLRWDGTGSVQRGRGPSRDGRAAVLLGHTRLSIIDLSDGGWQPMSTPDGRFHLTFNGEIYNYLELREQLGATYEFQSDSDSEVLLAAWATWGKACLSRLRGMFAFAVLDTQERTLAMAVDPFGIKPLHWVGDADRLAFASELTALVDAGLTSRRVAAAPLYEFLCHARVARRPDTMGQVVHRLLPGQRATFSIGVTQ